MARRGCSVAAPAAGRSAWNGYWTLARRVLHDHGAATALSDRWTGAGARTDPFVVAWVANFAFGALATLGIGNYGPSLVLFSLLGMDPRAAFPVMMGIGAFAGLVAAMRFIRSGCYAAPAAIGLTVGGILGC